MKKMLREVITMKTMRVISMMLCVVLVHLIGCTKKEALKDASTADLSEAKIGALAGSTGERFITENYEHAKLFKFDDIADAIVALKESEIDYVISTYITASNIAKHNTDILIKPGFVQAEGVAIAVNKHQTELLSNLSKVLERFKTDGTLVDISKRWVKVTNTPYERKEIPVHEAGKILRVGVTPKDEPMCFMVNGKIVGLDAELIERIAYELKMKVEFEEYPFEALLTAIDSELVDIAISNISSTKERQLLVNFTEDYFSNPLVLMKKKR